MVGSSAMHSSTSAALAVTLLLGVAACGPKGGQGPREAPLPPGPSELERRQAAACEALGPRLTECAIADARATMTPEALAELDIEKTAPVHTREFIASCTADTLSSRQVRVYEVCMREERECAPLLECLRHASPQTEAGEGARPE